MSKIRVLVVDDHRILRDGICVLLELAPDIEVVGEAGNGREALDKVRELLPDVVLMDIDMPLMDGLEAARGSTPATRRSKCSSFPSTTMPSMFSTRWKPESRAS